MTECAVCVPSVCDVRNDAVPLVATSGGVGLCSLCAPYISYTCVDVMSFVGIGMTFI